MKIILFLLLLIVLVFLSVKREGFDASYNSIEKYSNAHLAIYTIVFVLFIIIAFLIIKIRS
jgi:hypothetical protein